MTLHEINEKTLFSRKHATNFHLKAFKGSAVRAFINDLIYIYKLSRNSISNLIFRVAVPIMQKIELPLSHLFLETEMF